MTISVPDELQLLMRAFKKKGDVNWSFIASCAFASHVGMPLEELHKCYVRWRSQC